MHVGNKRDVIRRAKRIYPDKAFYWHEGYWDAVMSADEPTARTPNARTVDPTLHAEYLAGWAQGSLDIQRHADSA